MTPPSKSTAKNTEYHKTYRAKRLAEGRCVNCGATEVVYKKPGTILCQKCADVRDRAVTRYTRKLREDAWDAYGGAVCTCCGEAEEMFLTIDHIDGGGNEHRREVAAGNRGASKFYLWLRREGYPPGFQVLCQNCNTGKWRNGGVCPHESRRNSQQPGSEISAGIAA